MISGAHVSVPVIGNIGVSFKTPSEKRAANVIGGVIQSALNGNLTAFKCLENRAHNTGGAQVGVAKEKAVWLQGYNQVATTKPELIAQYNANINKIPPIDHSSPERAAASALANPYSATGVQTPTAIITADTPPLTAALAGKGLPLWLLLVLAGGIGFVLYKASRKG